MTVMSPVTLTVFLPLVPAYQGYRARLVPSRRTIPVSQVHP